MKQKNKQLSAWTWIPTLYFSEGLPYILVMSVAVVLYKRMGISNTDIALYTSWLYLPWVIKPFWSPFVAILKNKRWWIVTMQLLIGGALAGVALTIPTSSFFQTTLAFLWLLAFSSATHDIAADGFYMHALTDSRQSYFIGIRSTFYRLAMIAGQGGLIYIIGKMENNTLFGIHFTIAGAWSTGFGIAAAIVLLLMAYHQIILPKPQSDKFTDAKSIKSIVSDFKQTISTFFIRKDIYKIIGMLLFYRLGESQLVKIASPFLLDKHDKGGLALSTADVGIAYGTVGVLALVFGGILGGILVSRKGLKYWLWWMVLAINVPNLVYVYLAYAVPESFITICGAIAVEQFGYGFGFTAYMLYMIYVSEGEYKTAHFAFCTGIMALGMMIPGLFSGWIQELLGYQHFFIWIMICTIPSFLMVKTIHLDARFGRKNRQ